MVTTDFMTATAYRFDWDFLDRVSARIVNEVKGVCRVFYDSKYSQSPVLRIGYLILGSTATSKPPGTIEFE